MLFRGELGSNRPIAVFINPQTLDLVFQGRPRNSQPPGSSIWTRNAAASLRELRFDQLSFLVNQRRLQADPRLRFWLEPRLFHTECVRVAQDHGSFNHILKLTDVAWPVIAFQKLRSPLFYPSNP